MPWNASAISHLLLFAPRSITWLNLANVGKLFNLPIADYASAVVYRLVICPSLAHGSEYRVEKGELRVTHNVYDGHFDIPKTPRSQRSVPLGPKAVQILAARKPAVTNPEGLVFATREGSEFDRHNLKNRQLKSTCKELGLVGVNWHWLRHANATLLDAVGTPLGTVQALLGPLLLGDHPRGLLALDPGGCRGSGEKS